MAETFGKNNWKPKSKATLSVLQTEGQKIPKAFGHNDRRASFNAYNRNRKVLIRVVHDDKQSYRCVAL
jgi:hypothetical protein